VHSRTWTLPVVLSIVVFGLCVQGAKADVTYTLTGSHLQAGTEFTVVTSDFLTFSSTPITPTTSTDLFEEGFDEGPINSVTFLDSTDISVLYGQFNTFYTLDAFFTYSLSTQGSYPLFTGGPGFAGTLNVAEDAVTPSHPPPSVTIRPSDEKPVLTKPPPPALAVSRDDDHQNVNFLFHLR
jgi:hypothetical protein